MERSYAAANDRLLVSRILVCQYYCRSLPIPCALTRDTRRHLLPIPSRARHPKQRNRHEKRAYTARSAQPRTFKFYITMSLYSQINSQVRKTQQLHGPQQGQPGENRDTAQQTLRTQSVRSQRSMSPELPAGRPCRSLSGPPPLRLHFNEETYSKPVHLL